MPLADTSDSRWPSENNGCKREYLVRGIIDAAGIFDCKQHTPSRRVHRRRILHLELPCGPVRKAIADRRPVRLETAGRGAAAVPVAAAKSPTALLDCISYYYKCIQ